MKTDKLKRILAGMTVAGLLTSGGPVYARTGWGSAWAGAKSTVSTPKPEPEFEPAPKKKDRKAKSSQTDKKKETTKEKETPAEETSPNK
jgi:hypothetical protein